MDWIRDPNFLDLLVHGSGLQEGQRLLVDSEGGCGVPRGERPSTVIEVHGDKSCYWSADAVPERAFCSVQLEAGATHNGVARMWIIGRRQIKGWRPADG